MNKHNLYPGDRLEHEATGAFGTLTSTNDVSAVIEWDKQDGPVPFGILPVEDILPVPSPTQSITEFSEAEILTELARRGVAAPAGFKLEYFCSCGAGCKPEDRMEEDCEIAGYAFEGPSTYLTNSTGCQVSSDWTPEEGISFRVSCHSYNDKEEYVERAWTREELEQLPKMVERVLSRIDYAEAKAFFEHNPKPFKGEPTLDDLYLLAKDNGLSTPSTFQAYVDLGKGEAK